jgi:hypothetical protein
VNKGEPVDSIAACNLLAKDAWRATLADEAMPRRPEVASVIEAFPFPGGGEGLAGAGASPNRSVIGPSCESESVAPDSDSGEEVALGVAAQLGRVEVDDGSLIDNAGSDVAGGDEVAEPLCSIGIDLVVEGGHGLIALSFAR